MKFLVPVQGKRDIKVRLWINKFKILSLDQMKFNYKKAIHLITENNFKMNNRKR